MKQYPHFQTGYLTVVLSSNGRPKTRLVHRLVCEAFHGPPPSPSHIVAHNDGTRTKNTACNLRWATPKENSHDMVTHGKSCKGETNGNAKLSEDQALTVLLSKHRLAKELAADFGVSVSTVEAIWQGKTWSHLCNQLHSSGDVS